MDPQLQQHWQQINQQRAAFYGWFAGVFARELSKDAFAFYRTGGANALLAVLKSLGFAEQAEQLQAFSANLQGTEDERVHLMADFASCFLLDKKQSALPYASFYLDQNHQLYGDTSARMRQFLQGNQLQLHPDFKEPADHLAVYLAVMADWCQQVATLDQPLDIKCQTEQQYEFLAQALLPWLPAWVARLEAVPNLSYRFYPAMGRLLLNYIRSDAHSLQGEEGEESAQATASAATANTAKTAQTAKADNTSADGQQTQTRDEVQAPAHPDTASRTSSRPQSQPGES
ncbi:molecular chaperone TorD [Brackiella oedipodis]|uniref:molecular chaperone TorD n=1 Tax=Brackiella oedipodis TaxID=124225 RepID=UPI000A046E86|nr:molecular chaperone TorD [Brackiella oedipodis]